MAGRALAFADPALIKLARDEFVAVAGDDWYQRRRQDDEGQFFRNVANQGPRKGQGGSTRQGIYIFSAGGKLLVYRNHQDPDVMGSVLRQGLSEFKKLPAGQRQPGAVTIDDPAKIDPAYQREPPKGGLIVNVFTRILDRADGGDFCPGTCKIPGGDKAARDHLWLTAEEWKSLIGAGARKGDAKPLPERLVYRLARFHLVDNTRGEPPAWKREDVRKHDLKLRVEEITARGIQLKLKGSFLLATAGDPAKAERGFDVRLLGYLHYDSQKKVLDRFDVVAAGDHWGHGPYTRNARPGKAPLGIAFELARGDAPADRVPPQGARWLPGYLQAEK